MAPSPDPSSAALVTALHHAVRQIVTDALARGVGATMPTNHEYLHRHGIGAGTMQRALTVLRDRGALSLASRGRLGRTITGISIPQAWQAASLPPVRLLLPPSGPAELEVLEQALAEGLTELGIPHTVRHRRGGTGRMASVAAGEHDVALVSAGVVDGLAAPKNKALIRHLPAGTYYAPGRLVVVLRAGRVGSCQAVRRVAIDHQSPDHVSLTLSEFPEACPVELVETPFPAVPTAVLRGDVDAGIWHITSSVIPLDLAGLATRPLTRPAALEVSERLSGAVLVGWEGRPELASMLPALPLADLPSRQADALLDEGRV
jgi:hypothetical protein